MRVEDKWFIPCFKGEYFGTFIKENSKARLEILSELPINGNDSIRFPIITGKTNSGDFTLIDCIWSGRFRVNNQSNIFTTILTCDSGVLFP